LTAPRVETGGAGHERAGGADGAHPQTAPARAERLVAAARDDPEARLRLAAGLYGHRVGGRSIRPFRRAEIAFMRWQIRRGVLRPPAADRPGSPWWRAVNERLLRDATEAGLLCRGAPGSPSTHGVRLWVTFLRRPSPAAWYRAHNASIVAGYLDNRDLVVAEGMLERFFMDVALLRVLYAHSLVARPHLALGRIAVLAPLIGDPRRRAADLFLSLQNVLPAVYPLPATSIDEVLADEHYLARIFDYGVIAPRIEVLYLAAADDLAEPRLATLQDDGLPSYAWPVERGDVWMSTRSRIGIGFVGAVLGRSHGETGLAADESAGHRPRRSRW